MLPEPGPEPGQDTSSGLNSRLSQGLNHTPHNTFTYIYIYYIYIYMYHGGPASLTATGKVIHKMNVYSVMIGEPGHSTSHVGAHKQTKTAKATQQ